jgi:hypothetical protein
MRAQPPHPLTRRQALRMLAAWCWLNGLCSPVARATSSLSGRELRVITAADSTSSRQLLQALKTRYPSLQSDADPAVLDGRKGQGLYVAIGPAAFRRGLTADVKGPLISVLTSSQVYRQIISQEGLPQRERTWVSGVYADAAPSAQMQLIAALFDSRITVGVLLSDASAYIEKPLRQAASQYGIELVVEHVAASTDAVRSLTRLRGAPALLAVPDATLYGPDALRAILESTYRRGMPVIGFSAATVAAGTLATAYPTIDDVVADLFDLLDSLPAGGTAGLPEPRYPRYWRVSINDNVARSLGVAVSEKALNLGNSSAGKPG